MDFVSYNKHLSLFGLTSAGWVKGSEQPRKVERLDDDDDDDDEEQLF